MSARMLCKSVQICTILPLIALAAGCVGGGYGYGGGYGGDDFGAGYYENYGGYYGGWGHGYRVGPFRDGGHGLPSIPSRSHGGGFGGGHAGGFGGGHAGGGGRR